MQDEQSKYIDQGWAAMKETLDREMPVERRRRTIWWWFPVGIGALLLLGWALWNTTPGTKSTGPDPVANASQKLAPAETPETTDSFLNTPVQDSEPGIKATSDPIPAGPTDVNRRRSSDNAITFRSAFGTAPLLPSRSSFLSYDTPPPLLLADNYPTVRRDLFTPFDPSASAVVLLTAKQPAVPASILTFKNSTPWQLWVEVGTHHGGTNWLSGGQAGILFRKPLGKWQFQTGLSLGIRQLSYERGSGLVNLSQSEQDSQTDPDLGLGNPNNALAPLPTDLSLMGTQLRTQATLQRRFGDHLRVGLGVGASYWTNTRRQWTYSPGSSFQPTQESRDFVNQFSGSSGQQVAETAFRSFGVSALSGVEYQINPRWAAGLDYHFGLTNHSLVDGFVVYDRYGQVSIRYRIK
jgi:hypothetical protein